MTVGPPRTNAIGIFGGTFDPIHIGHLAIAEEARDALALERVLFVPTGRPVHKPGRPISAAQDRVAMVAGAIADNPAFVLSRAEVDRPGPSYAVDTLEALTAEARAAGDQPELVFILSSEAYAGLPSWRDPERILELCRLAVLPRPGSAPVDPVAMARLVRGADLRTIVLDGPLLAVSGSTIRSRVGAGRSIRYLVPDAVIAYIDDHGLYRTRQPTDPNDSRRTTPP